MVTLFAGGIRPLPPDNQATGIFKSEVHVAVLVGRNGLAGDVHADRRVHGGPEKAVHQYPVRNYALLAEVFPEVRNLLVPGAIGENLSVTGWDEANVCIGIDCVDSGTLCQLGQKAEGPGGASKTTFVS
jgi:MOSC domain-containing protein YiiM